MARGVGSGEVDFGLDGLSSWPPRSTGKISASRSPRSETLAPGQLKRAQNLIFDQLNQPLEMAEIAAKLDMPLASFSKAFKDAVGVGPYGWHLRRRVVRSAALLYDERLTLAEIAGECGFTDQSHYTKAFRRVLGVTPGRWRRKLREGTLRIGDALKTS